MEMFDLTINSTHFSYGYMGYVLRMCVCVAYVRVIIIIILNFERRQPRN